MNCTFPMTWKEQKKQTQPQPDIRVRADKYAILLNLWPSHGNTSTLKSLNVCVSVCLSPKIITRNKLLAKIGIKPQLKASFDKMQFGVHLLYLALSLLS